MSTTVHTNAAEKDATDAHRKINLQEHCWDYIQTGFSFQPKLINTGLKFNEKNVLHSHWSIGWMH
jgi:hypothetical protein